MEPALQGMKVMGKRVQVGGKKINKHDIATMYSFTSMYAFKIVVIVLFLFDKDGNIATCN